MKNYAKQSDLLVPQPNDAGLNSGVRIKSALRLPRSSLPTLNHDSSIQRLDILNTAKLLQDHNPSIFANNRNLQTSLQDHPPVCSNSFNHLNPTSLKSRSVVEETDGASSGRLSKT